jgi:protein lifeguard
MNNNGYSTFGDNNNNYKFDIESPDNNYQDYHKSIRIGFIRKVYSILAIQLLITVSLASLAFEESINYFLKTHIFIFYIALVINIIVILVLMCFKSIARKVPINYILLFIWTICESYMVATATSFHDPMIVMFAAILTLAVVGALTLYACTTKTDFTYLGGLLFVLVTVLLIWGIFIMIFGFFLYTLYCVFGLIVFSLYLIYDTQLIMGKFNKEYGIDDYIIAALNIYIDIIQIFLYVLQILGRR